MDLCSHAAAVLTPEAPRVQAQVELQGEQWTLAERGDGDDEAGAVWATFA